MFENIVLIWYTQQLDKIVIWRAVPADNGAPGVCVIRDSWAAPGNVPAQYNHCPASVGRGLDPADPVPVFDWYVEWNYFRNDHRKMPKNRHLISFVQPGRFRYLIGGVRKRPTNGTFLFFREEKRTAKLQFTGGTHDRTGPAVLFQMCVK